MFNIMFVCHGNICRSPMAEIVFRTLVEKARLQSMFNISSCATSNEEIGNPIYPPARAELVRNGYIVPNRRAVKLTRQDYDKYDLFVCMDSQNVRNATVIFGQSSAKIVKLMSFNGSDADVADPWYTGGFAEVLKDIETGCEALLTALRSEN